jgi:predicted transcriptional regulator
MPPHRDECPTTVGQFTYFLQQREIRRTPVLEADDKLAAMVSVSDISKAVNEGKNC